MEEGKMQIKKVRDLKKIMKIGFLSLSAILFLTSCQKK